MIMLCSHDPNLTLNLLTTPPPNATVICGTPRRVALGRTLTMRVADNSLNGEGLRKRGCAAVFPPCGRSGPSPGQRV